MRKPGNWRQGAFSSLRWKQRGISPSDGWDGGSQADIIYIPRWYQASLTSPFPFESCFTVSHKNSNPSSEWEGESTAQPPPRMSFATDLRASGPEHCCPCATCLCSFSLGEGLKHSGRERVLRDVNPRPPRNCTRSTALDNSQMFLLQRSPEQSLDFCFFEMVSTLHVLYVGLLLKATQLYPDERGICWVEFYWFRRAWLGYTSC